MVSNYPKLNDLHRTQLSEKYFKNNYPKLYEYIINKYDKSICWREKLYLYYHNLESRPICKVCGKPAKFNSVFKGYFEYCSIQCSGKSKKRLDKIHNTIEKKYGVRHALQSIECKEKYKKTSIERYGVDNKSKLDESRLKFKQTMLDKYGGIGNASEYICNKVVKTRRLNRLDNSIIENQIGYTDDGLWIIKCDNYINCPIHEKCDKIFNIPSGTYLDRVRVKHPLCTKLYPIDPTKIKNTSIELFIKDILNEYNIEYRTNVRSIISPKELDIYIPSKQIAIECNGVYWHSLKEPSYHINKYKECQQKGIQLLTLWEDWFKTKPKVLESVIKSKLGIVENKIGARKCIVKEVSTKECKNFLNENHIQGYSPSTTKLGLYYNDELVSVMTFSKSRVGIGKKEDGYELVRFCNKLNTRVVGGASKLLKYFIQIYNPSKIISYSSNDISNGDLYNILGFQKENESAIAYWYINHNTFQRYHRFNFRKQKLKEMGYNIENQTEFQIMSQLPYWKIFDSGTTRWVLQL